MLPYLLVIKEKNPHLIKSDILINPGVGAEHFTKVCVCGGGGGGGGQIEFFMFSIKCFKTYKIFSVFEPASIPYNVTLW